MRTLNALTLSLLACLPLAAAEPYDSKVAAMQTAGLALDTCVVTYARKYVASRLTGTELAGAAISACDAEVDVLRVRVSDAVDSAGLQMQDRRPAADRLVDTALARARGKVLQVVAEGSIPVR